LRFCGSELNYKLCREGKYKLLASSNFCRIRMCPMCAWRKTFKIAHQLKDVAHEAIQHKKMRWLFLTLTIKNCSGDDLLQTINHLMQSWKAFTNRKDLKKIIIGWFRAFEITRNYNDGSYHPHFHVLLGVPPSYFNGKGTDYLKTSDWALIWQECMKVDYVPIVDIRIVKNKRNIEKEVQLLEEKGLEITFDGKMREADLSGSAVAELAKYSTKAEEFIIFNNYEIKNVDKKGKLKFVADSSSGIDKSKTDEVVSLLYNVLHGRKLYAYGGELLKAYKLLKEQGKVEDVEGENADLTHITNNKNICPCGACGSDMLEEMYRWIPEFKQYIKKENEKDQIQP
jgi:plasmid rolling circle replication initiator protein Rep